MRPIQPLVCLYFAGLTMLTCAVRSPAAEGSVPVEFYILGDDMTESVAFEHVADPLRPTELRFVGSAHSEVGPALMYVHLEWFNPQRERVTFEPFTLPGTTPDDVIVPVPIDVCFTIPYSPSSVGLSIEGTGCCDQFRVAGTFQHFVVPEPSGMILAGATMLLVAAWSLLQRRHASR
jgi:hypothetical protein